MTEPVNDRDARVAVDLFNQLPFRECAGQTYGDDESDYTEEEIAADDQDVYVYHDSLRPSGATITDA